LEPRTPRGRQGRVHRGEANPRFVVTDPEARLYKKGDGQPAKLSYMGHALMENRNGLAVLGGVSQATGTAEREIALAMIDRRGCTKRITLGADKAYDHAVRARPDG